MLVAFGLDMLTGGCSSSGANNSCQYYKKMFLGQIGRANGNPVAAVYFNPQRVSTWERVRHAHLGANRFKMSPQHSCGGRTLGA